MNMLFETVRVAINHAAAELAVLVSLALTRSPHPVVVTHLTRECIAGQGMSTCTLGTLQLLVNNLHPDDLLSMLEAMQSMPPHFHFIISPPAERGRASPSGMDSEMMAVRLSCGDKAQIQMVNELQMIVEMAAPIGRRLLLLSVLDVVNP